MNTNISSVAERIDETCHSNKCESGKCLIDLTDLPSPPNRLIVDMDCNELDIPPDSKRCDYIIFLDGLFGENSHSMIIIPVEMKSGSIHGVTSIIEQIESGIEYAKKWIGNNSHTFIPVLVHNGIRSRNLDKLKNTSIRINNRIKSKLILLKCGERLINKLNLKKTDRNSRS